MYQINLKPQYVIYWAFVLAKINIASINTYFTTTLSRRYHLVANFVCLLVLGLKVLCWVLEELVGDGNKVSEI